MGGSKQSEKYFSGGPKSFNMYKADLIWFYFTNSFAVVLSAITKKPLQKELKTQQLKTTHSNPGSFFFLKEASLLTRHGPGEQWQEALELFESMKAASLEDVLSFKAERPVGLSPRLRGLKFFLFSFYIGLLVYILWFLDGVFD